MKITLVVVSTTIAFIIATTTEIGIISVTTATTTTPQDLSSHTRKTIYDILQQIQTWQQSHHEQQLLIQQMKRIDEGKGNYENLPPTTLLRPFVTATFAQSMDGYMSPFVQSGNNTSNDTKKQTEEHPTAAITQSNYPLSCYESKILTHGLRSIHDGILIGGRTLLLDNPRLTNRLWGGLPKNPLLRLLSSSSSSSSTSTVYTTKPHHQPQPIILDPHLRYVTQLLQETNGTINVCHPIICCTMDAAAVITTASSHPSLLRLPYFHRQSFPEDEHSGLIIFHNHNTNNTIRIVPCRCIEEEDPKNGNTTTFLNITDVFRQLYNQYNLHTIMVEGGAHTLSTLFTTTNTNSNKNNNNNSNNAQLLVDAMVITIAPQFLGQGIRPILIPPFFDDLKRWIPVFPTFTILGKDVMFITRCESSGR